MHGDHFRVVEVNGPGDTQGVEVFSRPFLVTP